MAATLELYDGTTTLDLLAAPYRAGAPLRMEPPPASPALAGRTLRGVRYAPRTVEVALNLRAASASGLRSAIRELEEMCAFAERRQASANGAPVTLRCQLGDANARDVEYRVLRGELSLPANALQEPALSGGRAIPGATLRLLAEPFGRLARVSPAASTIHNEQDGANVNYVDIANPGPRGANLRLKVSNPGVWTGSEKVWLARRSGARRTDTLFYQAESGATVSETSPFVGHTSTWAGDDATDARASGASSNVARMQWSTRVSGDYEATGDFTRAGRVDISVPGNALPRGLFRVLARVRVRGNPFSRPFNPDLYETETATAFALGWSFGGRSKTPAERDAVYADDSNVFQTIDLGELSLPPIALPDGYASPSLTLSVYGVWLPPASYAAKVNNRYYYARWEVDCVALLPIDEGAAIVNGVGSNDRILIDTISDAPGVYLLSSSDAVRRFADFAGGPFGLDAEGTRIYALRDDPADPSSVRFTISAEYEPLVAGM